MYRPNLETGVAAEVLFLDGHKTLHRGSMTTEHDNAQRWLTALDTDDYERCWRTAGNYFRNGIPIDEWTEKAKSVRAGVGQLQSRKLVKSIETVDIPVGPVGTYLINEYASTFTMVGEIGERLTLIQEEDGLMRVVGYFLI